MKAIHLRTEYLTKPLGLGTTSPRFYWIAYEGAPLGSRDRVEWTVTLWDEEDKPGEPAESWLEMGLLESSDWTARWISGDYKPNKKNAIRWTASARNFPLKNLYPGRRKSRNPVSEPARNLL